MARLTHDSGPSSHRCDAADLFKGIAPFNGPISTGGDFKACTPSRPVSVLQFSCGGADSVWISADLPGSHLHLPSSSLELPPRPTSSDRPPLPRLAPPQVCNTKIDSTMKSWAESAKCDTTKTQPTYGSATTRCQRYEGWPAPRAPSSSGASSKGWGMSTRATSAQAMRGRRLSRTSGTRPPPTGIPGTPILPGEANVDGYRYMMNRFSTLR